jgi:hypothetical protein
MWAVLISVLLFLIAVTIHLVICRISPDKRLKAKLFIIIALVNLVIFEACAVLFHLPLILSASLIYIFLAPIYLIFYVSTELVSPSKKNLRIVEYSGQAEYKEIFKRLEQENLIITRLEELEESGCVTSQAGTYKLTKAGRSLEMLLGFYQKILGRTRGG